MSTTHHSHETHHETHRAHPPQRAHRAATGSKARARKAETARKTEMPAVDLRKLVERFRLPGVDLTALADSQRKNVEALRQANQKAYTGAIALARRQAEIFEETMTQWQAAAKELSGKSPSERITKQAELARKAMESALGHMRELAEMAVKSQREAYAIIGKRMQAGFGEFQDYFKRRS